MKPVFRISLFSIGTGLIYGLLANAKNCKDTGIMDWHKVLIDMMFFGGLMAVIQLYQHRKNKKVS